jgi:dTDP-4-dehydrorhamnose reductase
MMGADSPVTGRKIALIGANGMLARAIRQQTPQGYSLNFFDLPEFDLTDRDQVLEVLTRLSPDVIINCAAYTNVDGAESARDLALAVNGTAVNYLAESAVVTGATLVHVSTDYVFDGEKDGAYSESDRTNPESVYGETKLIGEQAITDSSLMSYFIIRTSWLYGPGGNNFVETILRLASEREELRIISDQVGCPTYTGDLAGAIFALLAVSVSPLPQTSCPYGVYHFSNEENCSWYEFACAIVDEGRRHGLPIKVREIQPIRTEEYPLPARRPANSVFDKTKYKEATGAIIPEWRESLRTYFSLR